MTIPVASVLLGGTIGCSASDGISSEPEPTEAASGASEESPASAPTEDETTTSTPEPTPEPEPEPDGTYTSSCDYVFSENPTTGYRFVADAQMKNTGNVGIVMEA